jgi:uncharacterized protein YndB with AHSA1/START domain
MTDGTPTALRVERTFDAPAEAVFDAWTSPEVMKRWWHAGPDWETPVAEVDVRVGGGFRITMRRPDGERYTASGEYTIVDRPRRLAFTWTWEGADGSPGASSLVEVDFSERDGATSVVLTHSRLASAESARGHTEGWEAVLDNLGSKVLEGATG